MADRIFLLECKPLDPVSGIIKNAYFSSGLTSEADLGTADPYPVRLVQSFSHETSVFENNVPGETNTSIGSVVLQNTDGRLDYLLNYNWDNRQVIIKSGERGAPYASYQTEFIGVGIELTADQSTLVLTLKDNSYKLIKDLQTNKFLGSGGPEGGVELRNRRKPLLFGKTRNLSPVLIDIALLTSQINDGPMASIDVVYDRGVPLTFFQDYATYALLAAATIPPGNYATCLAQGYLRLGAPPQGIITVDAVGELSTWTNIPELTRRVLYSPRVGITSLEVNDTSFAEAAADCPYNFEGIYLAEPDFTVAEFIETMASSMNAFWYLDKSGSITFRQFRFRTPSVSIRAEDLMSLGKAASPSPLYRVRVNYAKNATIMNQGDFTVPIQTFNGYLTKRYHYVDISGGEVPGNYAGAGEMKVFLNDVQVNDFTDVQFRIPNGESWITIDNLGVITVTNSGVPTASALVRASIGEFSVEETFTMVRDATAPLQSMALSLSSNRFFFNDMNVPEPTNQTITITATGTNTTAPITITAKDNLNQNVVIAGGNTIPIANVSISPLVFYIEVTASDANGVLQKQRISVQHGVDAQVAATLEALAASNKAVTFFYQDNAPTTGDGIQVDDVWVDTNDGNKQYRWTGSVWSSITDTRVTDALTAAAGAQATADGKVKTYFSETAPTQPPETLALGDLWYKDSEKTLYRWSGTDWTQSVGTYGADFDLNVYGRPLSEVFVDEIRYGTSNQFLKRWQVRQGAGVLSFGHKDSGAMGGEYMRVTGPASATELVTNGTFASGTTGWTPVGATLSTVGGAMRVTNTAAAVGYAYQAITCVVGKTYILVYEDNQRISTGVIFQIANDSAGSTFIYTDAIQRTSPYTTSFTATQTTHYIRCVTQQATSGRYCDFDNISIKEQGAGDSWLSYKGEPVAFDPAATYEVEVSVRRPTGDGKLYAGLEGLASDGITVVATNGANEWWNAHWVTASNASPAAGSFTMYRGHVKGRAATGSSIPGTLDSPAVLHNNVIYIRPFVLLNFESTFGNMEFAYVRIRKTQTMDQLPEGNTWGKLNRSQLTNYNHKLTLGTSGMQIGDQRNLPPVKALNLGFKFGGAITYSTTTTNCAISITASSFYIGAITVSYNAMSLNIPGTAGTGPFTHYLYFDDPGYTGGSKTLLSTTDTLLIYQNDDRVFMGTVVFSYPSAGTGGGGGDVGGGGCVDSFSWVETRDNGWIRAHEVKAGDYLRILGHDLESVEWAPVLGNKLRIEDSVLMTGRQSGITLRCSTSTPLTLRDGSSVYPLDLEDQEMPIFTDELSWEQVDVEAIGHRPVAYISMGGEVYAAGDIEGRCIFTHNAYENPKP